MAKTNHTTKIAPGRMESAVTFSQRIVTFQDTDLTVIDRDGQAWLTCGQIDRALGAARSTAGRLYRRHDDEFTDDMTAVIPQGRTRVRIFSPRGCHLIAMFARTERAKAFRRWVLDVLDKLVTNEPTVPVRAHTRRKPKALDARTIALPQTGGQFMVRLMPDEAPIIREVSGGAVAVDGYNERSLRSFLQGFVPAHLIPVVAEIAARRGEQQVRGIDNTSRPVVAVRPAAA